MFHFSTPWKRHETRDLLTLSEGIEMKHWQEMGYESLIGLHNHFLWQLKKRDLKISWIIQKYVEEPDKAFSKLFASLTMDFFCFLMNCKKVWKINLRECENE